MPNVLISDGDIVNDSAQGFIGADFEDYLHEHLGGKVILKAVEENSMEHMVLMIRYGTRLNRVVIGRIVLNQEKGLISLNLMWGIMPE
ncbi:TPA: hypothetical protein R5S02_004517 [Salmonella enterica]|nr:hypothetical protein [Salmonella enterica]